MRILFVFFALFVAGCPSFERYEQRLDSWKGRGAHQLVSIWGRPDGVMPLRDGGRVFEYKTPVVVGMFCETRFTIDRKGFIQKWWYYGNDCRL